MCPGCGASGSLRPAVRRPIDDVLDVAAAQPVSASDLCKRTWDTRADPVTGLLYGPASLWLLYGPPGAGKTTMAAAMAGRAGRKVLLISNEMHLGAGLAALLRRAGVSRRTDFNVVRQASVTALVDASRAGMVIVLDSINSGLRLTAVDGRLVADAGGILLAVAQVVKSGGMAGAQAWLHQADLVLQLEGGKWTCEKSRFEPAGRTGDVPLVAAVEEEAHGPR